MYKYNTVLLIDDSELDNFINEKILQATCFSKNILISTNGAVALETIKTLISASGPGNNTLPNIIFIDLNMPIMNGFEFIENFKRINNPLLEQCKLVILTSSIHNDDRARAEKIDKTIIFINKPLTNDFLNNFPEAG